MFSKKELKLDKHPVPLEPSFFIVVVSAGLAPSIHNAVTTTEFYQSRCVAYTKKEALDAVMAQLQAEQPNLYKNGQALGGWQVTHIDAISATEMERFFKDRTDTERTSEERKRKVESNELLKRIIDTKDINLFHSALREGRITNYERLYLHDILTQGIPKEVLNPDITVSPYNKKT